MAIQRKRKWLWLSPANLHTFKVKAENRTQESDWAQVTLNLSNVPAFVWEGAAGLMARPVWYRRSIRIVWSAFPLKYRKWFDHYIIFRKEGVAPVDPDDFDAAARDKEDSEFFLSNTFERKLFFKDGNDDETNDELTFRNQFTAWNHFYFDENIQNETTYHYWVHAVNQRGELSTQYLGPDMANWGKPQTPQLLTGEFETQIHEINKWACDVKAVWNCGPDNSKPAGAEYYIIQRRQKRDNLLLPEALWGQSIRIDHDYTEELDPTGKGKYQNGVIHNFWVGKNYEFRIKAVNIPGIGKLGLESEWSSSVTYLTDHDTTAPPEVTGVAGNRFYWKGIVKGDYVRLKWDRFWQNDDSGVRAPFLTEQLAHYNIYRFKGTDANAELEAAEINLHVGYSNDGGTNDDSVDSNGEYITRKKVYQASGKFEGTHFIDDDIEETSESGAITPSFTWDSEGDTDDERATGYAGSTSIIANYEGTPTQSSVVHDGTWALDRDETPYWLWMTTANQFISGDEGYLSIWVYGDFGGGEGDTNILSFSYDASNLCKIWLSGESLRFDRTAGGQSHYTAFTDAEISEDEWHQLEIRWSVTGNFMSARIDGGTWQEATTTTPLAAFAGDPDSLALFSFYFDDLSIWLTADPTGGGEYYHYWVSAVDAYGYESDVSMGDSYDKVSFLPPPNVTGCDDKQEIVINHPNVRMYSFKALWDIIDEATHYQIRIKFKPPGKKWLTGEERSYSRWHYSAMLREERFYDDEEDDKASYTYPFPIIYETKVIFAVIAWNRAGKSPTWVESEEIIIKRDDNPPHNIDETTIRTDCQGAWDIFLGIRRWNNIVIRFQPRPHHEGVEYYELRIKDPVTGDWDPSWSITLDKKLSLDSDKFPSVRIQYVVMGKELPDWVQGKESVDFYIRTHGADGLNSEPPFPTFTVNWERWWQF